MTIIRIEQMATNFFRFQNAARRAMRPGQKLRYIPGQGYRLVPDPGYSSSGVTGARIRTPYGEFPQPPSAVPYSQPIDEAGIRREAETQARGQAGSILEAIAARQTAAENRARAEAESRAQQMEAAWAAAREPISKLYQEAVGQAERLENATANRLASSAIPATEDFAAKLAGINAPNAQETINQLKQTYAGAGASEFAKGMADVQALNRAGAADRSWVEKQGPLARQEVMGDLADLLSNIIEQYGDQRFEIESNIPNEINRMFESIYGRRADDRAQKVEQSRYDYEQQWRRKEYVDQRKQQIIENAAAKRKELMERQLVALERGDKKAAMRFEAQQKALDRQLQRDLQKMQNENSNSNRGVQEWPNSPFIEGPDGKPSPNPYYIPDAGDTSDKDTVDTPGSIKRKRVLDSIWSELVNPDTGHIRDRFADPRTSDMKIQRAINVIIDGWGIDPYSPTGNEIRQSMFRRLNGRPVGHGKGGKSLGTYRTPDWVGRPKQKPKKKSGR